MTEQNGWTGQACRLSAGVLMVMVAMVSSALAQGAGGNAGSVPGSIQGVVRDQQGAVLPGAVVTIAGRSAGEPVTAVTDAAGAYRREGLAAGTYRVTVRRQGLSPFTQERVEVRSGLTVTLDVVLVVASVEDAVTVVGTAGDDGYAPQTAVVAGKSPASLLHIPQSVSVVTRRQMEDRNLFTIGAAVQQVTGVTVMPFNGYDSDYRARGFVLDYAYDGVPSTFSSGVPEFDLVVYERLELQRGPTGLFRGAGSPGGTINLIRKRGGNTWAMSGAVSAGSWSNYRGEIDISGPLDAAGRLRVRAVASLLDRDFFQDKSHTRTGVAHGTLDYDLTRTATLGVSVSHQDNRANTPSAGHPAYSDQRFLDQPRHFQHQPSWNLFTDSTTEYAVEARQRVGSWSLVTRALRRDIPRSWVDAFVQPNTGVDPVTLTAIYVNRRATGENGKAAVDAYASGPVTVFGRRHDLAVGYSYDKRTTSFLQRTQMNVGRFSIFDADTVPQPGPEYTSGSETDLRQSGVHAQLRARPHDAVTLVLGGRLSNFTNRTRGIPPSVPTDFRVTSRERRHFTPSVGAVWELVRNVTLYGSYADIFNPQTALQKDGTVIEPRVGAQYEAGLKGRFRNGAVMTTAAVFRTRDKNRALADPSAPGFFVPAGVVRVEGFEFEVAGRPLDGLDVSVGYTNVSTEFEVGTAAQTGAVFDIFTPRHQFKGYARYEPAALGGAFASVGLLAQSTVVGAGVAGVREQGPFGVANVQLGYRFSPTLRAFLTVNNVLDRVYYVRVGSPNTYNYHGEPRSVLLTLRVNY